MVKANIVFRCTKYQANSDGTVDRYVLQIIDTETDATEEILVTPQCLASHISMKKLLMSRNLFYSSSRKMHDEMIRELFLCSPSSL